MRPLLALASAALIAACAAAPTPPPGDPGAPVEAPFGGGSTPAPPGAPAAPACAAGRQGACPATGFVTQSLCFDTAEAACECAGCARDACLVAESGPAQVRCR